MRVSARTQLSFPALLSALWPVLTDPLLSTPTRHTQRPCSPNDEADTQLQFPRHRHGKHLLLAPEAMTGGVQRRAFTLQPRRRRRLRGLGRNSRGLACSTRAVLRR